MKGCQIIKEENNINEKRKKENGYIKKDGEEKGKKKGGTKIKRKEYVIGINEFNRVGKIERGGGGGGC